ncbi:MAG: hypothetical protein JSR59_18915 [Proteobacteria bacterium]|nr:hypothetical protein [Pseudomonadota bacterium]
MAQTAASDTHETIDRYFSYIRALRNGDEQAVQKLVDLWDEDGVFEFAGAAPLTATFKGRNAIHVLYKNRVAACGMPLKLEGALATTPGALAREVALGAVETHVNRMRNLPAAAATKGTKAAEKGQRVAVGWTTTIATDDKQGFEVGGSHTFTFKGDKIGALKVVVSPKPEAAKGLNLNDLAVRDIGRLSLAAWAVV